MAVEWHYQYHRVPTPWPTKTTIPLRALLVTSIVLQSFGPIVVESQCPQYSQIFQIEHHLEMGLNGEWKYFHGTSWNLSFIMPVAWMDDCRCSILEWPVCPWDSKLKTSGKWKTNSWCDELFNHKPVVIAWYFPFGQKVMVISFSPGPTPNPKHKICHSSQSSKV